MTKGTYKRTKVWRENVSRRMSGKNNPFFGVHLHRFGVESPHYNHKHTKSTKEKMRKAHLGKKGLCGENNGMFGKHLTRETKEKIKKKLIGIRRSEITRQKLRGENNHNWKGGITSLRKQISNLPEYKQWRSDVFQRDNWTCQTCGGRSEEGKAVYLEAHHKKGLAKILKEYKMTSIAEAQLCQELWDVNNGVTLCKDCHNLTKK